MEAVAGTGKLITVVFELITWAETQGRLEELITKAREANPNNPELRAALESMNWTDSTLPTSSSFSTFLGQTHQDATPSLPSNNLPRQLTSFIGRMKEKEVVKTLLSNTCLLTLTGSGGCGKSRLCLQVAEEILDQYPDGVWLVELAPLVDPGLVAQTVAQVLDLSEQAGKSYTQVLTESLDTERLLLLLDNCEHLLPACAQFSDTLLRACPNVKILTSSRQGLGIAGEQTYRVPSLSLPDPKQQATAESVSQYESVRLFLERASLHKQDFAVTNYNATVLASVCRRLDGIPLAIELAAARVRSLTVEEIDTKLDNRFRLLIGGSRTALPRQQALRALIDWSYDLLQEPEKMLLCRLSVFAGGWTREAAEQVCAGEEIEAADGSGAYIEEWETLDLLTSLADKSLVVADPQEEHTRYRLLESVQQPARAARLWGAAQALRELLGAPLSPSESDEHDRLVSRACADLGEAEYARARSEGTLFTLEQAIGYALEESKPNEAG